MTVRELIEELEEFARHYGDDIKVVVNRSLKGSQPMYIKANGAYPAISREGKDYGYSSGYLDFLHDIIDEIPTREEFEEWLREGDTDYLTYEEFLEDNNIVVDLCVISN